MNYGSGVSRGDRNRNARLARLRVLVPLEEGLGNLTAEGARGAECERERDPHRE